MLTNVVRLLRQFNYDSLVFPSAEAFASHRGFDGAVCILLDIDLGDGSGIELRQRLKAANIQRLEISLSSQRMRATQRLGRLMRLKVMKFATSPRQIHRPNPLSE